jgi:hypothetical protein
MTRLRNLATATLVLVLGTAVVTTAYAQGAGGRRGFFMGRSSLVGLLRLEPVQSELKLSEEQIKKTDAVAETLTGEMRSQYGDLRDISDPQQRRVKMVELGKQLDEKSREQLSDILSQEQLMRLYQIRLQLRGPVYGLNHPWVAGRLELTDQQKEKVAELDKATQAKTDKVMAGLRDLSREERREKFAEIRAEFTAIRNAANMQALELLTDDQREAFTKMQGKKIDLASLRGQR